MKTADRADPLAQPGMLHCLVLACTMRFRQCLINRERAQVYPMSLYARCLGCRAAKSVKRHYQGEAISSREVKQIWGTGQQEPEGVLEKRRQDQGKGLSKTAMMKAVQAQLEAKGRNRREIHLVMVDMRAGDLARVREIWQEVTQ